MDNLLKYIFSLCILVALLGGGIVFILFLVAIIIGGEGGSAISVTAANVVMPFFIKAAALAIVAGLFNLYITKSHALSLQDGKNE